MLAPMTKPASPVPRHSQTMRPTTVPQPVPSSRAVPASRRNARTYQPKLGCVARKAWIVTVMDWMLTLSPSPRTSARKNARTMLLARVTA